LHSPEWLTALGICDGSVNFGGGRAVGGEDHQQREKRERSQAIEIGNGFHICRATVC
jgi:hypothetical protein